MRILYIGCITLLSVGLFSPSALAKPAKSLGDLTGHWRLFVDDHWIADKTNVKRAYHAFKKHPGNPVIVADKPWEGGTAYLYGTVLPVEIGPAIACGTTVGTVSTASFTPPAPMA